MIMMIISTQGRVHFYIFCTVNGLVMKHSHLIHIVMGNTFRKYFVCFWGLGPKPNPLEVRNLEQLMKNQLWWIWFSAFLIKCATSQSKSVNNNRSQYIAILSKLLNGIEIFSSHQNWRERKLEMFVSSSTNIWLNYILILTAILHKIL